MEENPDSRTIGELLALLAHDLRNPLSALHSNLGFLKSLPIQDDPDVAEAIDDGVVSCDGLSHIIDNIDLFGQALRGVDAAMGTRSDLVQVVRQVVARSEKAAASHGLSIRLLDFDCESLIVRGSHDLLERAAANLVRNSIQHAPPGSVVEVQCVVSSGRGIVRVVDRGPSLGEDPGESVFSAEGQVASKTSANGRYSRGMGLYCASLAASACGAEVACAAATESEGNTFELYVTLSGG